MLKKRVVIGLQAMPVGKIAKKPQSILANAGPLTTASPA
jgi:hypothetical protein